MSKRHTHRRPRRGYTVLEVTICAMIIGAILAITCQTVFLLGKQHKVAPGERVRVEKLVARYSAGMAIMDLGALTMKDVKYEDGASQDAVECGIASLVLSSVHMTTKTSERSGRVIDRDEEASMEKKKREGYF